jgi:uncharacterized protein involved in exopolysaccharide biosynthesis
MSEHEKMRSREAVQDSADVEYLVLTDRIVEPRKGVKTAENLSLLWDRRRSIGRIVLRGFLLITGIAFLIPSRYESTARLMPPDSNQAASGLAAVAAMVTTTTGSNSAGGLANDLLGAKSTSETFVGILSSITVEDELIRQFNLKRVYWDRRIEDARKDLADHTEVNVDRKSQIVSITVTDRNAKRATAMAQAYVEQLNRLAALLSTSSARRERIFLEGRLQGVSQELESSEKQFSQFASKNTAIDIKEQGKAMMEAAATLQGQLIAAQSELEGLRQIYTDRNVRVRSVRARIGELQRQLEKISGKGEDLSDASTPTEALYPSIRKLPILGVTYADLYRKTKVQEAVFETLTKQYELAKVQEAKEIPTVKVLDSPTIPEKKSFPPRTLIILLGTALSLCVAIAWVFGQRAWEAVEASDPRKILVLGAYGSTTAAMTEFALRVSVDEGWKGKFWRILQRKKKLKSEGNK